MGKPIEMGNEAMGAREQRLQIANKRVTDTQTELRQAMADRQPEAQIKALQAQVEEYTAALEDLKNEMEERSMGAAA